MTDLTMLDWAAFAFIGDAVYEIYVRKNVLDEKAARVDDLHKRTVLFVNAKAQARAVKKMMDELPESEREIVRKARNHKPQTVPRSATAMEYKWATALEALIGYLYMEGNLREAERVAERAIELIKEERDNGGMK